MMTNEHSVSITLFGNIQIHRDGISLSNFRHRKSLAVLAYLAATGESHSRESLAGLLWGQATDSNALGGLRKALAELRKALGPYLIEENRSVALNLDLPIKIDSIRFEQGIASTIGHKAEMLNEAKSTALREAIDLYTNDFLQGFYVQRAPDFEDWVTLTRERLRLNMLDGLYLLSKDAYRQSDYQTAIHYSRRLLEMEPCHEEAHRQLMSLLALTGQRDLALRQYELCGEILKETYNLPPQPETTNLYERIQQEPAQTTTNTKYQIPQPSTPLIGRQADLDALKNRLTACRTLTILGPGGSGKTHLTLELANQLAQMPNSPYPDGILFIPLAALRSIEALPSAIAYQVDFQFHKESAPIEQLNEYLSSRKMLLILDNFEHLIGPEVEQTKTEIPSHAEILIHILQNAPDIKILVTSRVSLNLQEEHIYPLGGIAYPERESPSAQYFADSPAVQLFLQNAQRLSPGFKADASNLHEIANICRQVQGLPLGILLAASWSSLLSPAEIATRLAKETGINLLETDSIDFPARQRSLGAVMNYSWKLLNPDEQASMAALSIFRGSFSLDDAQQVTGASLRTLRTLVNHSLIQKNQNNRFEIHEFTRQFAQQRLENREDIQDKFLDNYTGRFPGWTANIRSSQQLDTIQTLDQEIDNLRAAWDIAFSNQNLDYLDQAIETMGQYYNWRHRYQEGLQIFQELTGYFQSPAGREKMESAEKYIHLYAKALTQQGTFSPLIPAEAPIRQSLEILENLQAAGDTSQKTKLAIAQTSYQLALIISQTGQNAEAVQILETCLEIFNQMDERWYLAKSLIILGSLYWDQSKYELSKKHLMQSLPIFNELGDYRGISSTKLWLGMNSIFQGDAKGAQLIRESAAILKEQGEIDQIINGIELAAVGLMVVGNYEEAHTLINENVMNDTRYTYRQGTTIEAVFTTLLIHLGQYNEAAKRAENSVKRTKKNGNPYGVGFSLTTYGWHLLRENKNQQAFDRFQESVEICKSNSLKDVYTWARSSQSFAAARLEDLTTAQQAFEDALHTAIEIESYIGMVLAITFGLPVITELEGTELAIEISAACAQIPLIANSTFFSEFIIQPVQALANELPAEIAAAAQTRGRSLTLDEIIGKLQKMVPIH